MGVMYRLGLVLGVGAIALGAVLYLWAGWGVILEIHQAIAARPYPQPYKATIVGFESHHGRHTTTAPTVEVEIPGQPAFRFTSSRYRLIETRALRERVELVLIPGRNFLGQPAEHPEIGGVFSLWLGDLLAWLFYPALVAAVLLWARFSPARRPGGYTLPP